MGVVREGEYFFQASYELKWFRVKNTSSNATVYKGSKLPNTPRISQRITDIWFFSTQKYVQFLPFFPHGQIRNENLHLVCNIAELL